MSSLADRLARARRTAEQAAVDPVETPAPQTDPPSGTQTGSRSDPLGDPLGELLTGPLDDPLGDPLVGEPPAGPPAPPVQPEASARAAAAAAAVTTSHPRPGTSSQPSAGMRRASATQHDRLEELKSNVHVELLKQLGPHLYDANMDQHELDQRVRAVLADVLSAQDHPLSSSDRAQVTQEISDDILGYGPIEPFLRDPDVVRGDGQRPRQHLAGEERPADACGRPVRGRGAPAAHHRQDRLPDRPPGRRVQPDGRRPPPRRQPRQRGRPARSPWTVQRSRSASSRPTP